MDERIKYYDNHIKRLDEALLDLRLTHPQPENWAQISVPLIQTYLKELKEAISIYPFKKRSEEIYFFKYVKPVVMAKMIFMCEVYNTEISRLVRHTPEDRAFLMEEINEIESYFDRYSFLYEYYKEDLDTLDTKYFVRDVKDRFSKNYLPIDIDPVFFYGDQTFSTGFDYAFAKLRAMGRLKDHLENELEASLLVGDEVPKNKLTFTGIPADFVGMVEMLHHIGKPTDPVTGLPCSEEELYQLMRSGMKNDLPNDIDFNTLKLINGNGDFPEKMLDTINKIQDDLKEEERDIDYDDPDGDEPKT
jgi:hypothetical protein